MVTNTFRIDKELEIFSLQCLCYEVHGECIVGLCAHSPCMSNYSGGK